MQIAYLCGTELSEIELYNKCIAAGGDYFERD